MKRREFITLLGGVAAWPLTARAQQAGMPVIGYLSGRSSDAEARLQDAFRRGLEESGYVEGRNVAIEYRFSEGQDARLPALAGDLVRQGVAVLVATDTPSALVAISAGAMSAIVFGTGADPVKLGLVEALNRPGGNATGVAAFVTELGPKRLQLLREVVPHATLIAFIVNLNTASGPSQQSEMQTVAQALGQQLLILSAFTEREGRGSLRHHGCTQGRCNRVQRQRFLPGHARAACSIGRAPRDPCDLRMARIRHRRRIDELQQQPVGIRAPDRPLCRADS